jgi:hypothetical protein
MVTVELLSAMRDEDMASLGVTLGQRKVLCAAIKKFHGSDLGGEVVNDAAAALGLGSNVMSTDTRGAASLAAAGKQFSELFLSGTSNTQHVAVEQHRFSCFDPRLTLTVKAHSKKAVHITDFLTEKTKKRRQSRKKELVLATTHDNEERLVVRSDDQHPYSGIKVEEWVAANCRVMNKLLQTGELSRDDVEYYLAHTVNIMDYAERYEWESVLDFDHQYRELQAEHGFPWGTYLHGIQNGPQRPTPLQSCDPRSTRCPRVSNVQSPRLVHVRQELQVPPRPPQ